MCMRFVRDIIEGEGLGGEWKAHKSWNSESRVEKCYVYVHM
jgi:hypothetical protein